MTMAGDPALGPATQSLCPVCLCRIEARYIAREEEIFLEKTCPYHGPFSARIWQGIESWKDWCRPKIPIQNRFSMTPVDKGCPFDCGLCPEHGQHTCTAILDITPRCNLNCRFCFADARGGEGADPDLDELTDLMEKVIAVSPGCNLQLSGGEPTVRADLPKIIAAARRIGFAFVQLNTNGLILDEALASCLGEAGLTSAFLQFDGVTEAVYESLRGRPLLAEKKRAVRACEKAGIGVVLVPTLVPGINDDQIGDILRFGLAHAPAVRGVHFQPVSYFGRHPGGVAAEGKDGTKGGDPMKRISIPEVLEEIELQTGGLFRRWDFKPSSCEHALCSFTGKFLNHPGRPPKPLTLFDGACCPPAPAEQGAQKARASVNRHWKAPASQATRGSSVETAHGEEDGLDRFLRQAAQEMFTVSGMAFQDAWTLDLARLKGCCIHAVAPDGRLIPFCAYNLTRADGMSLYRGHP